MKQDLGATVELHSRQATCSGGAHASGAKKDRLLSLKAEPVLRSTPPLRLRRVQAVGGRIWVNMAQWAKRIGSLREKKFFCPKFLTLLMMWVRSPSSRPT
jgi:hypothetical protein